MKADNILKLEKIINEKTKKFHLEKIKRDPKKKVVPMIKEKGSKRAERNGGIKRDYKRT